MSVKKPPHSLAEKATIGILVTLAGINAFWAIISEYSGPVIALFFYLFISYLCWRRNHFQAGMIGGVFGLSVHIYEWLFQGLGKLGEIELAFFFANLILPIPLIYFSYRAHKETNR